MSSNNIIDRVFEEALKNLSDLISFKTVSGSSNIDLINKDLKKLPKFDYVLLLGILHHLNDDEIKELMLLIKKILKKNGNIITEDPILIQKQNPVAKLLVKMDRGNNVRKKEEYIKIIKAHFKKINSKIYHQQFIPYTWFCMNCKN